MKKLSAFLHLYLYEIESIINSNSSSLESVSFQSEEANTDKEFKIFIKSVLCKNNKLSPNSTAGVQIIEKEGSTTFSRDELHCFYISNVYLPKELTATDKKRIKESKVGVYTKPDIYILRLRVMRLLSQVIFQ